MAASAALLFERRRAPEAADPAQRRTGSVDAPPAAPLALLPRGAVVQRACCASCAAGGPCEDEERERGLQIVPADHPLEREADAVAARAVAPGAPAPAGELGRAPGGAAASLALGGGRPLDAAERGFFEPRLGADLGDVRIHTNAAAADAAQALGARAFTTGSDVAFAAGEFAPETDDGRLLLAHELAHTVQQAPGILRQPHAQPPGPQPPGPQPGPAVAAPDPGMLLTPGIGYGAALAPLAGTAAAAPVCTTAPPVFVPGAQLFFAFDSATLLPGQGPMLGSLLADARCASTIEFHGNASSEGTLAHNEALACSRAAAVAALFSGLPPRQTVIGHGATTAYGMATPTRTSPDPNRNVVVAMTFPTFPPPLPTRAVAPASAVPIVLDTWAPPLGCGAGDDSKSADFPSLTGGFRSTALITAARLESDSTLEGVLLTELVGLAGGGAPGVDAWSRFVGGTGGTAVHPPGSALSGLMLGDVHFLGPVAGVAATIEAEARAQAAVGFLDYRLFTASAPHFRFPPTRFGFGSGPLAAVLGGTQGTVVSLLGFTVLPCTRTYMATLRFVICDDFGVDEGDVYSPGLAAFWVLQHERPGHTAFINEVIVDVPISSSF